MSALGAALAALTDKKAEFDVAVLVHALLQDRYLYCPFSKKWSRLVTGAAAAWVEDVDAIALDVALSTVVHDALLVAAAAYTAESRQKSLRGIAEALKGTAYKRRIVQQCRGLFVALGAPPLEPKPEPEATAAPAPPRRLVIDLTWL